MDSQTAFARRVTQFQERLEYSLFMIALAIASASMLVYELWYPGVSAETIAYLQQADLVVAYIFFTDFIVAFIAHSYTTGWRAYLKRDWLNLVSSIPISNEAARALRILRAFRAIRMIMSLLNVWYALPEHERTRRLARMGSTLESLTVRFALSHRNNQKSNKHE